MDSENWFLSGDWVFCPVSELFHMFQIANHPAWSIAAWDGTSGINISYQRHTNCILAPNQYLIHLPYPAKCDRCFRKSISLSHGSNFAHLTSCVILKHHNTGSKCLEACKSLYPWRLTHELQKLNCLDIQNLSKFPIFSEVLQLRKSTKLHIFLDFTVMIRSVSHYESNHLSGKKIFFIQF